MASGRTTRRLLRERAVEVSPLPTPPARVGRVQLRQEASRHARRLRGREWLWSGRAVPDWAGGPRCEPRRPTRWIRVGGALAIEAAKTEAEWARVMGVRVLADVAKDMR